MLHRVEGLTPQPVATPSLRVLELGEALPEEAPSRLGELLRWWEAKAGGAMPDRAALDPVEIASHLAYVALLDIEAADFRFRLTGEEVRARYGPLRGRSLSELLSGRARLDTLAEHRACVVNRRPTLARRSEPTPDGSDQRRYWRLLLPFGRNGEAAVILAVMQFDQRRGCP